MSRYGALRRTSLGGATVAAGLMSGLFWAFSVSVMPGLSELDDREFVLAMQSINERIMNRGFFLVFFGVVVLMALTTILHLMNRRSIRSWMILAASVAYLVGAFGVTAAVNVPLNDALARVPANAPQEAFSAARVSFEERWNLWNDVRSTSSIIAFLLLVVASLIPEK